MKPFILIEVHKLLESCQVMLLFEKEFSSQRIQLSVAKNSITLKDNIKGISKEVVFKEIKLKPNSISGLMVEERIVTFRVQMESEMDLKLCGNLGVKYVPNVVKDSLIRVMCRCCGNMICDNVRFKRVLPLPSVDDWNVDDFFCHKHSHNEEDGEDKLNSKLKCVSKSDFLYSDDYSFKLCCDHVGGYKMFGVVHCDKCLSWIGKRTESYVKLWNSSVSLNANAECANPLKDFNNAILAKLTSSVSPVYKVVISCCLTNESTHFILLRILNNSLTVLTNTLQDGGNEVIRLHENVVVKVSYNYFDSQNETVESWLNDPLSESMEVSKQMLFAGCDSLINSTLLIVKPYRGVDNMHIGYLGLI